MVSFPLPPSMSVNSMPEPAASFVTEVTENDQPPSHSVKTTEKFPDGTEQVLLAHETPGSAVIGMSDRHKPGSNPMADLSPEEFAHCIFLLMSDIPSVQKKPVPASNPKSEASGSTTIE